MKVLRFALLLTVLALAGATVAFALPKEGGPAPGGTTTATISADDDAPGDVADDAGATIDEDDVVTEDEPVDEGDDATATPKKVAKPKAATKKLKAKAKAKPKPRR